LQQVIDVADDPSTKIQARFGIAQGYISCATNAERVEQVLREVIDSTSTAEIQREAIFRIGHAYVACKRYDDAVGIYDEILQKTDMDSENRAAAQLFKAKGFKAKGDEEGALQQYEQLRQDFAGTDVATWSGIESSILLQDRDPARAKRHILESLAEAPRFREAHKLLSKMAKQTNQPATQEDAP